MWTCFHINERPNRPLPVNDDTLGPAGAKRRFPSESDRLRHLLDFAVCFPFLCAFFLTSSDVNIAEPRWICLPAPAPLRGVFHFASRYRVHFREPIEDGEKTKKGIGRQTKKTERARNRRGTSHEAVSEVEETDGPAL